MLLVMFCEVSFCEVSFCEVSFCEVTFCRGTKMCFITKFNSHHPPPFHTFPDSATVCAPQPSGTISAIFICCNHLPHNRPQLFLPSSDTATICLPTVRNHFCHLQMLQPSTSQSSLGLNIPVCKTVIGRFV